MPIRITGLNSGLDTESIISALVSSYNYKTQKYQKAQTKLSWKQDAWKTLNTKVYSLYTSVGNLRFSSAYNLKSTSVSDTTKATVKASSSAPNGTQTLNVIKLAQAGYMTGGEITSSSGSEISTSTTLSDLGYTGGDSTIDVTLGDGTTKSISVSGDTKISKVISSLKDAGLSANFDSSNGRIYVSSTKSGADNDFTLSASGDGADALACLGLDAASATKIAGQDAEIKLNGVTYTGTSNSFTINGLTITAQQVTGDGDANAVTISTDTDTQGIYDKIKDFLSQYNSLINELNSLYNADSAKGYEPLTDEEKDSMSDTEVEKWEEKIKSAILRRDDTVGSLISSMTNAMAKSIEINGKNYSLSSFGIQTLGYLNAAENEQYAYHIYGDEDDTATSGKEDKLLAAITNDPDTVLEFMQGLATNLYNAIDTKMKSTTLSSVYTVYNDKEMASEYSDYTDLITKWQEKLQAQEDYYYEKFSAMETALAKLNSQTSSLSSMLG